MRTEQPWKETQAKLGRTVKMVAHLVEKNRGKYSELVEAVKLFPNVVVHTYSGEAENHAAAIARMIPTRAFRFVVIDPKGIPDVRKFRCLIEPDRTEVLLNFMFQFANRFASSRDRMPTLEGWLGGLPDDEREWREEFANLGGTLREAAISNRARLALRQMGGYRFAPALTVDETEADRPLYKLIYLSRHKAGIKVFRDAHVKALKTQATYKSTRKAEARKKSTGMEDMFAGTTAIEPGERSAQEIAQGEVAARSLLIELLAKQRVGIAWSDLWPTVLDACVVTHSQLGDIARELRLSSQISVPAWTSSSLKRPKDDFRLEAATVPK